MNNPPLSYAVCLSKFLGEIFRILRVQTYYSLTFRLIVEEGRQEREFKVLLLPANMLYCTVHYLYFGF